jgi:hypothetical protein
MSNIEWSELKPIEESETSYCNAEVFGGDYTLWLTQTDKGWEANINCEDEEVIAGTKVIKDLDDAKAYAQSLFRGYITAQMLETEGELLRFVQMTGSDKRLFGLTEQGLVYEQDISRNGWTPLKMKALY